MTSSNFSRLKRDQRRKFHQRKRVSITVNESIKIFNESFSKYYRAIQFVNLSSAAAQKRKSRDVCTILCLWHDIKFIVATVFLCVLFPLVLCSCIGACPHARHHSFPLHANTTDRYMANNNSTSGHGPSCWASRVDFSVWKDWEL